MYTVLRSVKLLQYYQIMKKSAKYIVPAIVLLLITGGLFLVENYRSSNAEADIKKMLIAKYDPGSCYGMPGPDAEKEPKIELAKDGDSWRYKVEDGRCCTVTEFEGVVVGEGSSRKITETRKEVRSVAC